MASFGPPEGWAAENGLSDRALRGWAGRGLGESLHSLLWLFGGPWARGDLASCSTLAWQTRSCAWEAGRGEVSTEKSGHVWAATKGLSIRCVPRGRPAA